MLNRTWQSLKETFRKRILPDIHNPYYKLTIEQISSFRSGKDTKESKTRKLEIRKDIGEDSNSNRKNPSPNKEKGIDIKIEGDKTTVEDILSKRLLEYNDNRYSTETLVLEEVYHTAEEIQQVLESPPMENSDEKKKKIQTKSLRDLITYTEPLTPMLQEVLDDFASESEDDSLQLVEDENPQNENNANTSKSSNNIEIENSTDMHSDKNSKSSKHTNLDNNVANNNINVSKSSKNIDIANDTDMSNDNVAKSLQNNNNEKSIENTNEMAEKGPVNDINNSQTDTQVNIHKPFRAVDIQNKFDVSVDNTVQESSCVVQTTVNNVGTDTIDLEIEVVVEDENKINKKSSTDKTDQNSTPSFCHTSTDTVLPNNQEALDYGNKSLRKSAERDVTTHNELVVANLDSSRNTCTQPEVQNIESKKNDVEQSNTIEGNLNNIETIPENNIAEKEKDDGNNINLNVNMKNSVPTEKDKNNDCSIVEKNVKKPICLFPEYLKKPIIDEESLMNPSHTDQHIGIKDKNNLKSGNLQKDGVLLLNSQSESDSLDTSPKNNVKSTSYIQRHKALANLLGFSSGTVGAKQKPKFHCRKRKRSRHITHRNIRSSSSEWESEEDQRGFITSPRYRKHKPVKKHMKWPSFKISTLQDEGTMFIMIGKKMYPLVEKENKTDKLLSHISDSESEEENYWKKKYVGLKRKAEELNALLHKFKEPKQRSVTPVRYSSRKSPPRAHQERKPSATTSIDKESVSIKAHGKIKPEEILKIKFCKNNEELQLEGHWQQIHPVLEQVVQIFQKDAGVRTDVRRKKSFPNVLDEKVQSSLSASPNNAVVDPEVREKVDKIETEIFKVIEEMDKDEIIKTIPEENMEIIQEETVTIPKEKVVIIREENIEMIPKKNIATVSGEKIETVVGEKTEIYPEESNVTTRRGKIRKLSTSSAHIYSSKKSRKCVSEPEDKGKTSSSETNSISKRSTKSLKPNVKEFRPDTKQEKAVQTRQNSMNNQTPDTLENDDDTEVRYKLAEMNKNKFGDSRR